MVSRIASGLVLPDSRCRSLSDADAELARMLAGGARELWEHAHGVSAVAGEQPVVPTNPQGQIGWNWSGPPWGSALRHPLAWWSGEAVAAGIEQPAPRASVTASRPTTIEWDLWIPPHDLLPAPLVAPYSRAYLSILAARTAGAATPTVTVRAVNAWPLQQADDDGQTTTFTGPTATLQAYDTAYVDVKPGHNVVRITLSHAGSATIALLSMVLWQAAKRSH